MTRLYFHPATDSTTGLPTNEQSALTPTTPITPGDAVTVNRSMTETIGTTQTLVEVRSPASSSLANLYFTRFVSPPLFMSSIPANAGWKYSIACEASTLSANFPVGGTGPLRIVAYVWRPSTATKVGDIIDGTSGTNATEAAAATEKSHNVTFSGAAVSGMQNGDVLVCEIWFPITQAAGATGYFCDFYYDGATVTTTDITVSNHASFIETPDTLIFSAPAGNPTRFYFHMATNATSGLPTVEQSSLTPAFTVDAATTNRLMNVDIGTTADFIRNAATGRTTSLQNHYITRFVSPPVYQTSIAANTWTYNFATRTTAAGSNYPVSGTNQPVRVNCYVWRPSTSTKIGTILEGNTASTVNEPTALDPTITCHHTTFTGAAVSSMLDGDVIIFEVWFLITQAGTTAYLQDFWFDGTTVTTTNTAVVTSHASFLQTPEELVLTPPVGGGGTRLYFHAATDSTTGLPTTEQSPLTAAVTADALTVNRSMDTNIGILQTLLELTSPAGVGPHNLYFTRFVSPPLAAGTIPANANWKYSVALETSVLSSNFPVSGTATLPRIYLYVWRPSTSTKIGNIIDGASTTTITEAAAATEKSHNVTFSGASVTVANGDVLIFEAWFPITQVAGATGYFCDFFYDGDVVTQTDTTVTNHATFIETPDTLTFGAPPPSVIDMTIATVKNLVNKFITKVISGLFNVQSATPTPSATNVAINVSPQVVLTEAPTAGTVNTANVKLLIHSSGVEIVSTVSLSPPLTIIIDPSTDLANNTEYRISLPAGGVTREADGIGLSNTFTSTFTTVTAVPPPTFAVQSVTPSDAVTGVAVAVSPVVTMDAPFVASSATTPATNVQLLNHATSASIPITVTTPTSTTIDINPTSDLTANTTYRIFLPSGGIKRLSDNVGLTDDFVSTFTTVAAAPYTVSSTTPTSGATGIAQNVVPRVTMAAPYVVSSATTTNVQLLVHSTGAVVPSTVSTPTSTAIDITPTSNLSLSTVYRISLPAGGVKRLSDNVGLNANFTSTFTITASAPAAVDHWGTPYLYPTATGGRVYFAKLDTGGNRTIASGARDGTDDMRAHGDSDWVINTTAQTVTTTGSAPRLYFYDVNLVQLWENVEITGWYRYQTYTGGGSSGFQGFELGNRGQHELGGTNARTYYTRNPVAGTMQRLKEEQHSNVLDTVSISGTFSYPANTWIGVKFVLRNKTNGGVHMESWRDTTDGAGGGTWVKSWEFDDNPTGSWGGWPPYVSTLSLCRCMSFFFRTDNMTNFSCKKISAHTIDPMP